MENGIIGKFKGVPFELDIIPIKDGDTLVITVDPKIITVDVARDLYSQIREMYPNNIVICLAKGMTLSKENDYAI